MPIEFRSGLPGAGKTLGAVEHLMHLRKTAPERPVYQLGITDLRDGLAIPLSEDQLTKWQELPSGSIIVVDECQKWMPARRGAAESPQWIKDLSTHRHLGLDFILISQHPSLIDPYVRKLVDRHIHTVRVFGTEWIERWSWPLIQADPNAAGAKKQAENKSRHKYSKEAMAAYKSAELHTVKRRVPKFIYIAGAVLLALPLLGMLGYQAMRHAGSKAGVADAPASSGGIGPSMSNLSGQQKAPLTREEWVKQMVPRVAGIPWSAPVFDGQKVQAEPDLYCVKFEGDHGEDNCRCLTEQGTHAEVPHAMCKAYAEGGVYNPYRAPITKLPQQAIASQSSAGSVPDAQHPVPDGAAADPGTSLPSHERATATAYTPPTYGNWDPNYFGGGKVGR